MILLAGLAAGFFTPWTQSVGFVVNTQEMVDDRTAFTRHNTGVGVLKGSQAVVLGLIWVVWAIDAIWYIIGLPCFDGVREVEGGED